MDTDREKYTFSYLITDADTAKQYGAKIHAGEPFREAKFAVVGSGLNAGLSTEGTRTMTFTGTLFSLFSEAGTGVFKDKVTLKINPDVDYKL